MKKLIIILLALLFMCGMNISSFAQTSQVASTKKTAVNTEVISGKVTSINAAKNEITVQENKTAIEKTITTTPKVISALKVGEEVKVTLKKGGDVAVSVKKIIKKTKSVK